MKNSVIMAAIAVSLGTLALAAPAEARHHYRHYSHDNGHGRCLRFNKTTGTVAGAVGGGLLGKVAFGSPVGVLAGAAAGGLAGHELANNRRKHC